MYHLSHLKVSMVIDTLLLYARIHVPNELQNSANEAAYKDEQRVLFDRVREFVCQRIPQEA
jgi:hypothetical protein